MPGFLPSRLEGNCASVHRGGIDAGRHAVGAHEKPRHVALISETGRVRSIGEGDAIGDQLSRLLEPALDEIGVRRQAGHPREAPQELELADTANRGQIVEQQRRGWIIVDARALARLLWVLRPGPAFGVR